MKPGELRTARRASRSAEPCPGSESLPVTAVAPGMTRTRAGECRMSVEIARLRSCDRGPKTASSRRRPAARKGKCQAQRGYPLVSEQYRTSGVNGSTRRPRKQSPRPSAPFNEPAYYGHTIKGSRYLGSPKYMIPLVAGGGFEPPTFGL